MDTAARQTATRVHAGVAVPAADAGVLYTARTASLHAARGAQARPPRHRDLLKSTLMDAAPVFDRVLDLMSHFLLVDSTLSELTCARAPVRGDAGWWAAHARVRKATRSACARATKARSACACALRARAKLAVKRAI